LAYDLTVMRKRAAAFAAGAALVALASVTTRAQVVGKGAETARPVAGDPGISSHMILDQPEYRVLRDYAEPGATRRMHAHKDATFHVFTLVTGSLRVTIEGQPPVEIGPGDVLHLNGGVTHGFTNIGKVPATIVEVFGKAASAAAR
jgi:quercetin dioxygenase-like cupin family protein